MFLCLILLCNTIYTLGITDDCKGFKKGPVKFAALYMEENGERWKEKDFFYDENGKLTEYNYYGKLYGKPEMFTLKAFLTWENDDVVKVEFYRENGELKYKEIYRYDDSNLEKKRYISWIDYDAIHSICDYYNNGSIIERIKLNKDDEQIERYVYEYNESGKEISYSHYNDNNSLVSKSITKWYSSDQKESYITYDQNGNIKYEQQYVYDEKGNVIEESYKNEHGIVYMKWIKTYDEKNRVIKTDYYENEINYSMITYQYDDLTGIVTQKFLDKNGNYLSSSQYLYDKDGRILKSTEENGNYTINEYHENGKQIKSLSYDNQDRIQHGYELKLDEEGKEIEYIGFGENGQINHKVQYEYLYDPYGNLIEKVTKSLLGDNHQVINDSREFWEYEYFEQSSVEEYNRH